MASSGKTSDSELLQQGHGNRLPHCSLTDEELEARPGLANLLTILSKHMDSSGLNVNLAQQLEEAKKELQLQKAKWLKWEALHRILQEALRGLATDPSPQDKKFLEVLEQQLLITETKQMLEVDASLQGTQTSVLGLEPSRVLEFLPPKQELEEMQKRLPMELEKLLKSKCLTLLSYYRPESDDAGETARIAMLGTLAESIAEEKQRLQEAKARHQELVGLLEQQKAAIPQVLLRCIAMLKRLAQEYRLGTQSELDQQNTQYFEAKCSATFLKLRLEELNILLETYTPEKVEVYRMIRDNLRATLSQEEQELATSRQILSEYEMLGPDFEKLVKEYAQLQEVIENRRWVLTELKKD